jgi:hypothetical protein
MPTDSASQGKLPKNKVQYSLGMKRAHCGVCDYFHPQAKECDKVEGKIDPRMWCIKFTKG